MIDKKDIIFIFKKSYNISYNKEYFCCTGASANIYDVLTGELKFSFKDMKQPSFSVFTSDNRLIEKTTRGSYYVYDLVSQKLINIVRKPKGVSGSITDFAITPDNKYIIDFAYVFPVSYLMRLEIETGEYSLYNLNNAGFGRVFYDENEAKYYVVTYKSDNDQKNKEVNFYSFSYPFDKIELRNMSVYKYHDFDQIDYNSGKFLINAQNNAISIYDTTSDKEEQIYYDKVGVLYDLKWSKNRNFIVLVESGVIRIYDVETKKCVKSIDVEYGCFADFYDNDKKLLIGTWKQGYCIDISAVLKDRA